MQSAAPFDKAPTQIGALHPEKNHTSPVSPHPADVEPGNPSMLLYCTVTPSTPWSGMFGRGDPL